MTTIESTDPRAIRTRKALQQAFLALAEEHPYESISVTAITVRAGLARHTFYNHYDTRDDLLAALIDSVLGRFFTELEARALNLQDTDDELQMIATFFHAWKDNPDVVRIVKNLDIDDHLITRLKAYFTKFYYEQVTTLLPGTGFALARYMINFNAYSMLGLLKVWLEDDMRHPPEVMAQFLVQLTGADQRKQAMALLQRLIG